MVEEAGRPIQEDQDMTWEQAEREAAHEARREVVRSFWGHHFFQTTTEQYEESIRRARAIVMTPRVPPLGVDMNSWAPFPHLQPRDRSEYVGPEDQDPEYLERSIESRAADYRTLSIREAVMYEALRNDGAHERLPSSSSSIDNSLQLLTAEQEEALFLELERREAFDVGIEFRPEYMGLTNRERWRVRREEEGHSWNPATNRWSSDYDLSVSQQAEVEIMYDFWASEQNSLV